MAISNYERIGKGLSLLRDGLKPFVERELKSTYGDAWTTQVKDTFSDTRLAGTTSDGSVQDVAALLVLIDRFWGPVFKFPLGRAERSLVNELIDVRNNWAHQATFSGDDTDRALDSMARLLTSVSAKEADEVTKMKQELRRLIFDEQVRGEKRRSAGTAIETSVAANLKPWREVVQPHKDVASGRYQQAEFAADLWQVHLGQGTSEYRDPVEFFRRTYLTESLQGLLVGAVERLTGRGGDPVIQLQTNFGGGKTHSMLALFHLFSGIAPSELPGIEPVMRAANATGLPSVRRVVLVGNKISPGNPTTKPDGTVVRTLWGELAWQLGGSAAFAKLANDDEHATSPGDLLRELFVEYGPCLVLVDEWVAYARQLHDQSDLAGGSFETQFSFAQTLTESAKLAKNCLLVISLPASDTATSPHAQADDVEVGGARGREALDRLQNVVGRLESSWRPASAEEGFEIVRRRLFEPLAAPELFKHRDVVARSFVELYRSQHAEFPLACRESDYETRIKAAYPIHPEVFDRLYSDWGSLPKFQRTRGVLRLMAAVIHSLWERVDKNPLILPANIPIDDPRVQNELTRYLPDNWTPVIEKDVDGPSSLPLRLDSDVTNLGRYSASRRVARTIYLGSAPITAGSHKGIEDRQVKLGCVMPGEPTAVFGDALRRLAGSATYLYQDGPHYHYSTQPTVTKLAEDRAEQLRRDPDKVVAEVDARLRANLKQMGDFRRVHAMPQSSGDVPDDPETRLVVLSMDHPYSKDAGSDAERKAKEVWESRGSAPRVSRNALVFLAADKTRLQELDEAVRKYLAWKSIVDEAEGTELTGAQKNQAKTQMASAETTVVSRIPETYHWLLVPVQDKPTVPISWQAIRLQGTDPLAVRASKKLRSDELMISTFGATRLRKELDGIPLWDGDSIEIRKLVDYFGAYVYLPRLTSPMVLLDAISGGLGTMMWRDETFAYADSYDAAADRYRGLVTNERKVITDPHSSALLVRPERAARQLDQDRAEAERERATRNEGTAETGASTVEVPPGGPATASPRGSDAVSPPPYDRKPPKLYHGSVELDTTRVGVSASKIADEVIAHLSGLIGAKVRVRLEIEAEIPGGAPDHVIRTVTENGRTLKFTSQGFEVE